MHGSYGISYSNILHSEIRFTGDFMIILDPSTRFRLLLKTEYR
jgi:hypothetical protein